MLAVIGVVACAIALLFALPRADAGAVRSGQESEKPAQTVDVHSRNYEGVITDTHCGAKHSAAVGLGAADCTRTCVHSGEHFALVDGEKTYALEGDEAALKRLAGQRVKIVGALDGNTISVASVAVPAS